MNTAFNSVVYKINLPAPTALSADCAAPPTISPAFFTWSSTTWAASWTFSAATCSTSFFFRSKRDAVFSPMLRNAPVIHSCFGETPSLSEKALLLSMVMQARIFWHTPHLKRLYNFLKNNYTLNICIFGHFNHFQA